MAIRLACILIALVGPAGAGLERILSVETAGGGLLAECCCAVVAPEPSCCGEPPEPEPEAVPVPAFESGPARGACGHDGASGCACRAPATPDPVADPDKLPPTPGPDRGRVAPSFVAVGDGRSASDDVASAASRCSLRRLGTSIAAASPASQIETQARLCVFRT